MNRNRRMWCAMLTAAAAAGCSDRPAPSPTSAAPTAASPSTGNLSRDIVLPKNLARARLAFRTQTGGAYAGATRAQAVAVEKGGAVTFSPQKTTRAGAPLRL